MEAFIGSQSVGTTIDFASAGAQTINYNTDGTVNYVECTVRDGTYRQTFGYTSGNLTSVSQWVKQ